jgi:DNA polymerase-3 subunit gamma/tau
MDRRELYMNIALAIKYRPKSFDDLIGQESVSRTLSLALDSDRLGHAYLFSGLRGSGKTSTARIFAKALVCDNAPTSKPCGVCKNCLATVENSHIDIIEMDGASNRKIDDIRDIIEDTKYPPSMAKFKIFIIDEVHMLTKEAFNALLKTLEEPPSYVKFILATTDPLKLPPTILSRTQHFRFNKIPKNDIIHHLKHILALENVIFEDDALDIISRSGGGSLRDTLTLIDQAIIYSNYNLTKNSVVDMLGLLNPSVIEEIFETILDRDRDKLLSLIRNIEDFDSEMIIEESIHHLKNRLYNGDLDNLLIDRFFYIASNTKSLLAINADQFFAITLMYMKMLEATNILSIEDMIEELRHTTPTKKIEAKEVSIVKKDNFEILIDRLYQREKDLGDAFKNGIFFDSIRDDENGNKVINLINCIKNLNKKSQDIIKNYGGYIKAIILEIYKIDNIKWLQCPNQTNQEIKQNKSQGSDNILHNPFVLEAINIFEAKTETIKVRDV